MSILNLCYRNCWWIFFIQRWKDKYGDNDMCIYQNETKEWYWQRRKAIKENLKCIPYAGCSHSHTECWTMISIWIVIIDLYSSPFQGLWMLRWTASVYDLSIMYIVPWGKEVNFLYPQATTEIVVIFEKWFGTEITITSHFLLTVIFDSKVRFNLSFITFLVPGAETELMVVERQSHFKYGTHEIYGADFFIAINFQINCWFNNTRFCNDGNGKTKKLPLST